MEEERAELLWTPAVWMSALLKRVSTSQASLPPGVLSIFSPVQRGPNFENIPINRSRLEEPALPIYQTVIQGVSADTS